MIFFMKKAELLKCTGFAGQLKRIVLITRKIVRKGFIDLPGQAVRFFLGNNPEQFEIKGVFNIQFELFNGSVYFAAKYA